MCISDYKYIRVIIQDFVAWSFRWRFMIYRFNECAFFINYWINVLSSSSSRNLRFAISPPISLQPRLSFHEQSSSSAGWISCSVADRCQSAGSLLRYSLFASQRIEWFPRIANILPCWQKKTPIPRVFLWETMNPFIRRII